MYNQGKPSGEEAMGKSIELHNNTTPLRDLLAQIKQGAEILLVDEGVPVARVLPVRAPGSPRIAGLHEGSTWVSDDFDDPLPDEFWLGGDSP
jgi:antitoxin (DNA-binding transcriptional repressor) of toxin-antitoxin stability system